MSEMNFRSNRTNEIGSIILVFIPVIKAIGYKSFEIRIVRNSALCDLMRLKHQSSYLNIKHSYSDSCVK